MERFDVLDKNRNKLGYEKERGSFLEENEYNLGCEIYFINEKGILLNQRSKNKSHPLQWEVCGGCAQSGQDSMQTIIREVKEELGINITEKEIKKIDTKLYKKMFVDIYLTNKLVNTEKITIQTEEVSDIKYVTKKEFEEMGENNELVPSVYSRYLEIKNKLF